MSVPERQAQVQEQMGDTSGAHPLWECALRLNPYRDRALVAWVKHLTPNECAAASSMLDAEPYAYWPNGNVTLARAFALACAARWALAEQLFVDVLESDPANGDAALGLGRSWVRQQRRREALDALCVAGRVGAQRAEVSRELRNLSKTLRDCVPAARVK